MVEMESLFKAALGLTDPWYVKDLQFDKEAKRLIISIDFKAGSRFFYKDKEAGNSGTYPVYDTVIKRWRHLNFFEHECCLEARVPRIITGDGNVRQVEVPWGGRMTGFTLLFEALILALLQRMPVHEVGELFKISDNKLWELMHRYVEKAKSHIDFSAMQRIGIDETSARKGHDYITLFVDMDKKSVVHIEEGRGAETIKGFAAELEAKGAKAEQIKEVSSDLSPAFISGIAKYLPAASLTFDRFHVMKIINEAVDKTRKWEKSEPALKNMRYILLKNRSNLNLKDMKKLADLELNSMHLKTVKAHQMRENFQLIFEAQSKKVFIRLLRKWCVTAEKSGIFNMEKAAKTIRKHWLGIANWHETRLTNGILEGFNSLIQAAKAKARGYRTKKNLIAITYLILGKLDFSKVNKCCQPT